MSVYIRLVLMGNLTIKTISISKKTSLIWTHSSMTLRAIFIPFSDKDILSIRYKLTERNCPKLSKNKKRFRFSDKTKWSERINGFLKKTSTNSKNYLFSAKRFPLTTEHTTDLLLPKDTQKKAKSH